MNLNTRFYFFITKDGFQVGELLPGFKKDSAHVTLRKIEAILAERKPWIPANSRDTFLPKDHASQRVALGKIAHLIVNNYLNKGKKSIFFNENTHGLFQKLKALCLAIDNRITPPENFPLPPEIIAKIAQLIPKGWGSIACLNRYSCHFALVSKAKELGCIAKEITAPKAYSYITQLILQCREIQKKGFLPQGIAFLNAKNILAHLRGINDQGESLIHAAARHNLPHILKLAHAKFPSYFNRKQDRKTAAQIASEQNHPKVLQVLINKNADLEGSKPAALIMTNDVWLSIFSFLPKKEELVILGSVSIQWRAIAKTNQLWKPIYQAYFPKTQEVHRGTAPHGYWKDKLANYFVNRRNAIFSETIIPIMPKDNVYILGDFLIVQSFCKLELWGKNETGKFKKLKDNINHYPGADKKSVFTSHCIGEKLIATREDRTVRLMEINSDSSINEHFYNFPFSIETLFNGDDRIFVQGKDGSLNTIGRKRGTSFGPPGKVELPSLDAKFQAASGDWLLVQDGRRYYMLKRSVRTEGQNSSTTETDYYQRDKTIRIKDNAKLQFTKTPDGTLILLSESPEQNGPAIILWKLDPLTQAWKPLRHIPNNEFLATDGGYLFLSESSLPRKNIFELDSIRAWKWDPEKQDYIALHEKKGAKFFEPYVFRKNGNSFTASNGLLSIVNEVSGNLNFLDASGKSPSSKRLERGSFLELQNGNLRYGNDYHSFKSPRTFFEKKPFGDQKILPTISTGAKHIGFMTNGSLVTLDEGKGIIVRQFDVSATAILEEIAQRFFTLPSLTEYNSEEEAVDIAHLFHRVKLFPETTKDNIYIRLWQIITSTYSTHWWKICKNQISRASFICYPYEEGRDSFYQGHFPYSSSKTPADFSSDKEQIAQAIRAEVAYIEYIKRTGALD